MALLNRKGGYYKAQVRVCSEHEWERCNLIDSPHDATGQRDEAVNPVALTKW